MKIVTKAQFVPGVCLVCGGSDSDRPWFLDIEKQAEFWGNIYFCNLCCGTMAFLFRAGDVSVHEDRIRELELLGTDLLERTLGYESALATLRDIPVDNSRGFADLLAHREINQPEPGVGESAQPAGERLAESSDDERMGELPEFEFVPVQPDTNNGW